MQLGHFLKSRIWQDWVFLVGTIFFDIAAAISLINPSTVVPLFSSIATAVVGVALGYTQYTLNLKITSIASYVNALIWALIAIYRN
jgi:hypothetical protein